MEGLTATVEFFMPELEQAAMEHKLHKKTIDENKTTKRGNGDKTLGADKNLNVFLTSKGLCRGNEKTIMKHTPKRDHRIYRLRS